MSVELMSLVMKADLSTVPYIIPATDTRPEMKGTLGHTEKAVLLSLADRGTPGGHSIYPSVQWLAKANQVSERTVQRALLRLKHTIPCLLMVEKPATRYSTTHYQIMVSALEQVTRWKLEGVRGHLRRAGVTACPPSYRVRGDTVTPLVAGVRGDSLTPDTSVEAKESKSKANRQESTSTPNHQETESESTTAHASVGCMDPKLRQILSDKLWSAPWPGDFRRGEGGRSELFRALGDSDRLADITLAEAQEVVDYIPGDDPTDYFDHTGERKLSVAERVEEILEAVRDWNEPRRQVGATEEG